MARPALNALTVQRRRCIAGKASLAVGFARPFGDFGALQADVSPGLPRVP